MPSTDAAITASTKPSPTVAVKWATAGRNSRAERMADIVRLLELWAGLLMSSVRIATWGLRTDAECNRFVNNETEAYDGDGLRRFRAGEGESREMSLILVGVDGSPESTNAVRWAAHAAQVEGLDLKIVAAYSSTTSDYAPGLVIPQDVIDAIRSESTGFVQDAAAVAREVAPDVKLNGSIVEGDAARVLLELGENAQITVLGTRGLSSVKGSSSVRSAPASPRTQGARRDRARRRAGRRWTRRGRSRRLQDQ